MRVAKYYSNRDVRLEEMPAPKIGPGELLVKITASGICGSDVMEWYRRDKVPLVLGHEIAGVITEVGAGVTRYKKGGRISASHHVPCNTCHFCLNGHPTACETLYKTNFDPGGFAEYVRLPAINVDRGVYPLPDEVSDDEATFIEPLACVLRARQKAGIKPGQSVLIIGSGISGLLHLKLARALGAGWIAATDINQFRLKAARKFGAETNDGRKADLVIICTGAEAAIRQGLASAERGGTVILFAPTDEGVTIPLSVNEFFWRADRTITTSYAGSPADHLAALELIRSGRVTVKDMITHRLPLSEIPRGFQLVAEGKESLKVIIEPQK